MADKRKIKTTQDGDTKLTQLMFGSGYKKPAKASMYETDINLQDPDSYDKLKQVFGTQEPSHEDLINNIEADIFTWLKDNNLPTEVSENRYLPITLQKRHLDVKGAFEASFCLTSIDYCKSQIRDQHFERAYREALNLVGRFYNFKYSILEPVITQGSSNKTVIKGNSISEQQADVLWQYYSSNECIYKEANNQQRNKNERLNKTAEHCLDEFNIVISAQSLRRKYFKNR